MILAHHGLARDRRGHTRIGEHLAHFTTVLRTGGGRTRIARVLNRRSALACTTAAAAATPTSATSASTTAFRPLAAQLSGRRACGCGTGRFLTGSVLRCLRLAVAIVAIGWVARRAITLG